jgi:hypothetical protein
VVACDYQQYDVVTSSMMSRMHFKTDSAHFCRWVGTLISTWMLCVHLVLAKQWLFLGVGKMGVMEACECWTLSFLAQAGAACRVNMVAVFC